MKCATPLKLNSSTTAGEQKNIVLKERLLLPKIKTTDENDLFLMK
jgi:hypothetical protein